MCLVDHWTSNTCDHRWLTLTAPCGPGQNLLTCPFWNANSKKTRPRELYPEPQEAPEESCPECDYTEHDLRVIRMIEVTVSHPFRGGYGYGYGKKMARPRKKASAKDERVIEVTCAVM